MRFPTALATFAALSSTTTFGAVLPNAIAQLVKRDNNQNVLTDNVWTSTSSRNLLAVTPTAIDGVTMSASPVSSSATKWVSLDSSGIPYAQTPSVSDGTTLNASPTPTDSNYPEPTGGAPPVLRCMNDRVPAEGTTDSPFCIANGTELIVGETYWITWDPSYWGGDIERVRLQTIAYPMVDDDDALWTSEYVNNNNGYYPWFIKSSYTKSGSGYFWLTITPLADSNTQAEHVGTASGPMLRIIGSAQDSYAGTTAITRVPSDNGVGSSSSGGKSSSDVKTIVPAVVVPVVVVGILLFVVIYYFKNLRGEGNKKGFFSSIKLSNSGYFGSKAQRTRQTPAEAIAVNNDNASVVTDDLRSEYSRNDGHTIRTESTGHEANPFK